MTKKQQKSQAELEIGALADVFSIATTGFKEYYKKTKDAAKGNYSTAASSGNSSAAASSGDGSKAASSGDGSTAASSGDYSACAAIGYRAAVKGDKGNLLMASEYTKKNGEYVPIGGKADIVDGKKLKADCWYIVEGGEWVEVDFTDEITGACSAGVKVFVESTGKDIASTYTPMEIVDLTVGQFGAEKFKEKVLTRKF